jgi:hypothetical protein
MSRTAKPHWSSRVGRWLFGVFVVLSLAALGFRVLRPVFFPRLHHETPKQTSTRMFDDNSFFR